MVLRAWWTVTIALAAAMLPVGPAHAQKQVTAGANAPGTVFYAIASGIAKLTGDSGALEVTVQPHARGIWDNTETPIARRC